MYGHILGVAEELPANPVGNDEPRRDGDEDWEEVLVVVVRAEDGEKRGLGVSLSEEGLLAYV